MSIPQLRLRNLKPVLVLLLLSWLISGPAALAQHTQQQHRRPADIKEYLEQSALKPGGRIAIIDFHHDDRSGSLGFSKSRLIPRDTVLKEMSQAGYAPAREHTFLPRQYVLEFAAAAP